MLQIKLFLNLTSLGSAMEKVSAVFFRLITEVTCNYPSLKSLRNERSAVSMWLQVALDHLHFYSKMKILGRLAVFMKTFSIQYVGNLPNVCSHDECAKVDQQRLYFTDAAFSHFASVLEPS